MSFLLSISMISNFSGSILNLASTWFDILCVLCVFVENLLGLFAVRAIALWDHQHRLGLDQLIHLSFNPGHPGIWSNWKIHWLKNWLCIFILILRTISRSTWAVEGRLTSWREDRVLHQVLRSRSGKIRPVLKKKIPMYLCKRGEYFDALSSGCAGQIQLSFCQTFLTTLLFFSCP